MRYLIILLLVFVVDARGQSVYSSSVEVQIVNDSLKATAEGSELTISLRCKNNSVKNLIVYGFDSNLLTTYVDRLCANQERIGGGIGLLVFNEKFEREYAIHSIPDSLAYNPMPKERFEQLMEFNRVKYLAGTRVLKALDIACLDKKLDIHEFLLRKGTYHLQIIIFAGKSLMTKRVGMEQIEKDKKYYNADLYQGCVISNTITFRID